MSIKFSYSNVYDSQKHCVTNSSEIFPLLMEDLRRVGYTQVSFNEAGDKIKDHSSWDTNSRNEVGSFLGRFRSPMAHHSIFVYPSLESNYSHVHSQILERYGLTWGGGNIDNYSIKPEFSRYLGACVFDLVDGKWHRKRRRWGKGFISLIDKFVCSVSPVCSDKDIRMIACIDGFSKALSTPRKDLVNFLDSDNDVERYFAMLFCPLDMMPLYIESKDNNLRDISRYRMGLPIFGGVT